MIIKITESITKTKTAVTTTLTLNIMKYAHQK